MDIRADLMDAHMYAFNRSASLLFCLQLIFQNTFLFALLSYFPLCISLRAVLQEVLDQKDKFQSLKQDVLPYLVRSQLVSLIIPAYSLLLEKSFPSLSYL